MQSQAIGDPTGGGDPSNSASGQNQDTAGANQQSQKPKNNNRKKNQNKPKKPQMQWLQKADPANKAETQDQPTDKVSKKDTDVVKDDQRQSNGNNSAANTNGGRGRGGRNRGRGDRGGHGGRGGGRGRGGGQERELQSCYKPGEAPYDQPGTRQNGGGQLSTAAEEFKVGQTSKPRNNRRGGRPQTAAVDPDYVRSGPGELVPGDLPQRGGRGNRGRGERGGRSRGERGGGRGRGGGDRRRPETASDKDFFEARKNEREGNQVKQARGLKQSHGWEDKGGKTQNQMMVGSTSALLEDEGEKKNKKAQKLKIIQRDDNTQVHKDKSSVKYNFKDFLNNNHNLTDQCQNLVESICQATQECIICSNSIYQRSALWNCRQCCQPFHLGCIKRWIRKLNTGKDTNVEDEEQDEYEEEKVQDNQDFSGDEFEDGREAVEAREKKIAKNLMAFFSWTCPNCNYSYAENKLPTYKCFCGRFEEPEYNHMQLPHSCGEYCDRKKHDTCTHGRCEILCHPGSCPPCSINVPVACYCGKDQQRVACQIASRSKFACENKCGKLLNCLTHECERNCHEGPCNPCTIQVTQKCYCGKEETTAACGSRRQACGKVCGKELDCGKHTCERRCHEGKCDPCPKDPSRMRYCPCGYNSIEKLLGKQRKACTDPIPLCGHQCEKFLPCGKHQCQKQCHASSDGCQTCNQKVIQECVCGKDKRKVPCFTVNYPSEQKKERMTEEELEKATSFKCNKICNQNKSCKRHKCKQICCNVKKGTGDPDGHHICLLTCNKTLGCGQHKCNDFCHIGACKPCRVYSREPLFCPCGIEKLEPPIKCGQVQPTCGGQCQKALSCGHQCALRCHLGSCPPCLEPVTKSCMCGKEKQEGIACHVRSPNCGQQCNIPLKCGHICQRICHPRGQCFESIESLMENGCKQRCMKQRKDCQHRCQDECHPGKPCTETQCEAEMRHYCKCGNRYVLTICKSIMDRQPLECNAHCWKKQRNDRLANAFSTGKDFEENKSGIKFEYYPEESLEFARTNPKYVLKVESQLTDVVLQKSSRSFLNLSSSKRGFITRYVYEHFKLEMCNYGNKGSSGKTVTDVIWKEGCKVPEIMISEVISLIEKGIMSPDREAERNKIFEASLVIYGVPKGIGIDDIKKMFPGYQDEFYPERRGQAHQNKPVYMHFYKRVRANDAYQTLRSSAHMFDDVEVISHRKEIGTNSNPLDKQEDELIEKEIRKRADKKELDDDGFTVVKRF